MGGAGALGAVAVMPGVDSDEVDGSGGEAVAQVSGGRGAVAGAACVGAVDDLADGGLDPGAWAVAFPPGRFERSATGS